MPTFTVTLKDAIDYLDGDIGLTTAVAPFTEPYPIFDETYRAELNTKIMAHFWNYEVGLETLTQWRFNLARKMQEIMPYYNQMYLSERLNIDPLSAVNMTTTGDASREDRTQSNDSTTSQGDTTASAITVNSDFPQTSLGDNTTGNYGTSSTESKSDSNSTSSATDARVDLTNAREEQRTLVNGYNIPQSQLLQLYRNTFLNIDVAIIADLNELFMGLWDNGDTYTRNGYL